MQPRYPSPSKAATYKKILTAEAAKHGITVSEYLEEPKNIKRGPILKAPHWRDAWVIKRKLKITYVKINTN